MRWDRNIGSQIWYCVGPTLNAPPFNTMDFIPRGIVMKLVFASQITSRLVYFFFLTDGPQMYPSSIVHDVFYHVNDDGLEIY
jgi:hypothetical protein